MVRRGGGPGAGRHDRGTSGRRRPGRRLLRAALAAAVLLPALYLGVTFANVWRTGHRDAARPSDAIVVLGAAQYDGRPSPALRRRLDHAVELWDRGVADTVVVTGGKRPGDRYTEAAASATYLSDRGVPDKAILREVRGRTSWESLVDASALLRRRGITRVVLVSDGYHAARIEGIAGELGLDAVVSPVSPGPGGHRAAEVARYAEESVVVAAGRIVGYQRVARAQRRVRDGQVLG